MESKFNPLDSESEHKDTVVAFSSEIEPPESPLDDLRQLIINQNNP